MDNNRTFYNICSELNRILTNKENPQGYVLRVIKIKCSEIGISEDGINQLKKVYEDNKDDIDMFLIEVIKKGIDEGVIQGTCEDIKEVFDLKQRIEEPANEVEQPIIEEELPMSMETELLIDNEEEQLTDGEEKQRIARKLIEEFNRTGRIKDPVIPRLSPKKINNSVEPPSSPGNMQISTIQNIKLKNLETDAQKDAFIKYLCMNGITLSEISIDNIPVTLIKSGTGHPELYAVVNVIKARINNLLSIIDNKTTYSDDIKRVLGWILGDECSLEEIEGKRKFVENYLRQSCIDPTRKFVRVMNDCFKNSKNDDIDNCTMVFILERLKINGKQVIKDNPFYNGYKSSAKRNIEKIIRGVYMQSRSIVE